MTSPFRSTAPLAALVSLVSSAVLPIAVHAQTPPTSVVVPPPDCENPGPAPFDKNSPQMGRFTKKVEDYKTCVNAYVKVIGGKSNELADQSKAYNAAANKAIEDYNAYIVKLNESQKAN